MESNKTIETIELSSSNLSVVLPANATLPSRERPGFPAFKTCLFTYVNVASFAILGCLIRVGVDYGLGSNTYMQIESSSSIIFQSFFANMLGSFILGIITASTLKSLRGMLPIYTGLSTGLCGSITTYSKFNQQVSQMIVGETITSGESYFTAFAAIILGLAAPICSFKFGQDISNEVRNRFGVRNGTDFTRQHRSIKISKFINYSSPIFLLLSWISLLVVSIVYRDTYEIMYPCLSGVLAPFGAVLRYVLSKLNTNPCYCLKKGFPKRFFMGTFLANFIGSIVMALVSVVLLWTSLSCPWHTFFKSLQGGFCACLTTVSTFVSEITAMRTKGNVFFSHCYAFFTIALCQFAAGIINGVSFAVHASETRLSNSTSC